MEITSELLAAYAEGNVSDSERNAVRHYLAEHPEKLETVMIMMDEDFDIQLDNRDDINEKSNSFGEELCSLLDEIVYDSPDVNTQSVSVLPLMSKAAQNVVDNLCAVKCEGYALRALGIDVSDDELQKEAEENRWLKPDGTSLYSIGQLSAKRGLFVSRKYNSTIDDITKALEHGDVVIAVIDNTELGLEPYEAEMIDRKFGKIPNHAIIINSVDVEKNRISLLNPGKTAEQKVYPLDVFLSAWNDSANYLIISNRCHYKPHPIDMSDVTLDDDIIELKDVFAENAHEVWAQARIVDGWTYGSVLDEEEKTDPYLLPYDLLPNREKKYYQQIVIDTIKLAKKLGWNLKKQTISK